MQIQQPNDGMGGLTPHPAFGGDPEFRHHRPCGGHAAARAFDAVFLVQQAEAKLGAGLQRQVSQRREVRLVIAVDRNRRWVKSIARWQPSVLIRSSRALTLYTITDHHFVRARICAGPLLTRSRHPRRHYGIRRHREGIGGAD